MHLAVGHPVFLEHLVNGSSPQLRCLPFDVPAVIAEPVGDGVLRANTMKAVHHAE